MEKQRTLKQNAALHKMFKMLSDELNTAGLDMRATLKPEIDIWWNEKTIKEYLWRPIQKMQVMKESTTDLTTREIDQVFETLAKHLGEKFGIELNFPSIDILMEEELNKNI